MAIRVNVEEQEIKLGEMLSYFDWEKLLCKTSYKANTASKFLERRVWNEWMSQSAEKQFECGWIRTKTQDGNEDLYIIAGKHKWWRKEKQALSQKENPTQLSKKSSHSQEVCESTRKLAK